MYCLAAEYTDCSVYQNKKVDPLPRALRGMSRRARRGSPLVAFLGLGGIAFLLLFASLILGVIRIPGLEGLAIGEKSSPSPTVQVSTRTPTENLPTLTPTSVVKVTKTPKPLIPTSVTPHSLETPFGGNPQLVIHKAIEGEGFIYLAEKYGTSVDAIRAINYNLPEALWVNKILVIPVGTGDVTGIPPFSIYQVTDIEVKIEDLAVLLEVDDAALKKFNALPDGYLLNQGDWVIIPHQAE